MPRGNEDRQKEVFTRLVEPHFDRLFRLACRLTGSRADAEDLLQDVMIRLYQQRDRLDAVAELKPWLSRVLYNRFIDSTRASRRRPLSLVGHSLDLEPHQSDQAVDPATDPALAREAGQRSARLQQCLERLSEEQRVLLVMHDVEGYTLSEIETITDIPTGTLKSRLSRSRARLRELLWDFPEKNREPSAGSRRVGG